MPDIATPVNHGDNNDNNAAAPTKGMHVTATDAGNTTTTSSDDLSVSPNLPMLPDFCLRDQVIIVTGGARGLGLAQAEALLESGANIHVVDVLPKPDDAFLKVQKKATSLGVKLHYSSLDCTDEKAVHEKFAEIAKAEGRLDGLLACAGVQHEVPALEHSAADFLRVLNVNVVGVFLCAQAAALQMKNFGKGGSIAFIASMSGTIANRDLLCCAYNSSKAAVMQLARNLATEWGQYGIRVNTLSPGYCSTEMLEMLFETQPWRRESWEKQNPLGRLSKPHEFRGAAVFLMSKASAFMNGTDLRIDGGHACW